MFCETRSRTFTGLTIMSAEQQIRKKQQHIFAFSLNWARQSSISRTSVSRWSLFEHIWLTLYSGAEVRLCACRKTTTSHQQCLEQNLPKRNDQPHTTHIKHFNSIDLVYAKRNSCFTMFFVGKNHSRRTVMHIHIFTPKAKIERWISPHECMKSMDGTNCLFDEFGRVSAESWLRMTKLLMFEVQYHA